MTNEEIDFLCITAMNDINKEISDSHNLIKVMELAHTKVIELKHIASRKALKTLYRDFPIIVEKGIENVKNIMKDYLKYIEEPYNRLIEDFTNDFSNLSLDNLSSEDDWLFLSFNLLLFLQVTLYIYYPRVFLEELEKMEKAACLDSDNYGSK